MTATGQIHTGGAEFFLKNELKNPLKGTIDVSTDGVSYKFEPAGHSLRVGRPQSFFHPS